MERGKCPADRSFGWRMTSFQLVQVRLDLPGRRCVAASLTITITATTAARKAAQQGAVTFDYGTIRAVVGGPPPGPWLLSDSEALGERWALACASASIAFCAVLTFLTMVMGARWVATSPRLQHQQQHCHHHHRGPRPVDACQEAACLPHRFFFLYKSLSVSPYRHYTHRC
jgi:hypothetical protein